MLTVTRLLCSHQTHKEPQVPRSSHEKTNGVRRRRTEEKEVFASYPPRIHTELAPAEKQITRSKMWARDQGTHFSKEAQMATGV